MATRKKLGQGTFSKCFEKDENTVIILSVDPIKKHMSEQRKSRFFPRVDFIEVKEGFHVYEMDKLNVLSYHECDNPYKLNERAHKLFKYLYRNPANGFHESISIIRRIPAEYRAEKRALMNTIRSLKNAGLNVSLDSCPQNFAVTETGDLIFMDAFFADGVKDLYDLGLD